jgi:hypothetical protein
MPPAVAAARPGDRTVRRLAPWELPPVFWHLALTNACVHLIREDERIAAGSVTLTDAPSPSARQDCHH